DGRGAEDLIVPTGGMRHPRSAETAVVVEAESGNWRSRDNLYVNGPKIFEFTLQVVPQSADTPLRKAGKRMEEVDFFVLDQAHRPSVRQAYFGDYEQIAAAEAASGLTPRPGEEWLHLWRDNPAYQSLRDWPIGWVLEDECGRIVGSIGNIPLLFHLGGSTYLG